MTPPTHTHTQRWPTGWRRGSEEDALGSSLREEPTAGSCRVTQGSRNLHDETERSDPGRGQGATTPATGRGSCGHPVATGRGPPWAPPPALKRPSGPAAEAAHGRGRPGPLDRERGAGATPHPPPPQRCGGLGRAAARRGAAGNAGSRKQRVQVGKIESPGLSCPCSHRAPPSAGRGASEGALGGSAGRAPGAQDLHQQQPEPRDSRLTGWTRRAPVGAAPHPRHTTVKRVFKCSAKFLQLLLRSKIPL